MDKVKTLLLNHGEKIVAVIFGLVGFMTLTSANWSPDDRNPATLKEMTTKATAKIESNPWPEEDQTMFADVPDVESLVRDNAGHLTRAEDFEIGSYNPSLYRMKEKRTAVIVLQPESPRAVPVVFTLAKPPKEEEEEETEEDPDEDKKDDEMSEEDSKLLEELEKRYARRGAAAGAAGGGYPGEGLVSGSGGGSTIGLPGSVGSSGAGALAGTGDPGAMLGAGGAGGGYTSGGGYGSGAGDYGYGGGEDLLGTFGVGMMTAKKEVRVAAGVAVTMIVDLQKQRSQIRKALHLNGSFQLAQREIEFIQPIVERRRKNEGLGSWAEWEPVSVEDLAEILKESLGIDKDIVNPAVTRSSITMPLPRRAAGSEWPASEASHPRVEEFVLSQAEQDLIDKWNQKVRENIAKQEELQPKQVRPGGFGQFVQSATDLGNMYGYGGFGMGMGGPGEGEGEGYDDGSGGMMSSIYGNGYGEFASDLGEGTKLTNEQKDILDATKATAEHRLLLVRFMDFTIERGHAYQYRVRLEMRNPNYDYPLEELADPGLGLEPTLFSDWSDPTPEAFVPLPDRIYLSEVDGRPGTPERVTVSLYTDTTETGLPVLGTVRTMMGLPLAGKQSLEVVDLTTETVGPKEVLLKSDDVLSAAEEVTRPSSSEHKEIKSFIDQRRGKTLIPDQVCLIDGIGDIKLMSADENPAQLARDKLEAQTILKIYDSWKVKDTVASDFFGGGEGEGEGEGGYGEGGGLGMGSGAAAAGGYYGGGYPGAGGDTGSGRSSRRNRRSGSRGR